MSVAWVALALSIAGCLVGVFVLRRGIQLDALFQELSAMRSKQRYDSASSSTVVGAGAPTRLRESDFQDLQRRVADLERLVSWLRERAPASQSQVALSVESPTFTALPASDSAVRAEPQPEDPIYAGAESLPGVLSDNDEVRVTSGSRAMVEIRWRVGESTAEVWINRDYKFADITADLVASAFDVDGGGPGSYATIRPAIVAWGEGARAGRVHARGHARALGA
jgi:hypothetical protein